MKKIILKYPISHFLSSAQSKIIALGPSLSPFFREKTSQSLGIILGIPFQPLCTTLGIPFQHLGTPFQPLCITLGIPFQHLGTPFQPLCITLGTPFQPLGRVHLFSL